LSISALRQSRAIPCRSLAEYIERLFSGLQAADPSAARRIRQVVGKQRARISIDAETVDVFFERGRLRVVTEAGEPVDGIGRTTRDATLDLIDGYLEVTTALLDGRLELTGSLDAITRMGVVLETLIDGATRAPGLQRLGRDFREDPCRPPRPPRSFGALQRETPFYGDPTPAREQRLLADLDLLP
jgi:hypothetical protein